MELWTMRIPEIGTVTAQAERAERLGWDGITFTDSQNLVGDPFVGDVIPGNLKETIVSSAAPEASTSSLMLLGLAGLLLWRWHKG
jgi:alkanesulfonate monooxygenase SsuD/methylene tetrahydromethanopterin reductase-like flavin-dependent oxidoreductase (luciferase family)